jgi:hypothetical protein
MEFLKKQNEELNARLTAAEARSSEKQRERAECREKDKRDRVHHGKRHANPQEDNESTVQGENEEDRDKSCRIEGGSQRDRSHREESPCGDSRRERLKGEKSCGDRREGERSRRSRRHRDNEDSWHSHQDAKMKDLEEKYTRMLRRMDGEDPELTAWDMLENESLPFTERVKAYPMPDKFKMPRIEKYDGSGIRKTIWKPFESTSSCMALQTRLHVGLSH